MTNHDDAVRRGAALLDERGPAGWRDRLDRDRLYMHSVSQCVLGQLYRRFYDDVDAYTVGLDALGAPANDEDYDNTRYDWAVEHGFDGPDYDALERAWRDHLTDADASVDVPSEERVDE